MIATSNARPARKTNHSAGPRIAADARPTLGYVRLYRRLTMIRNELLMNIAAASRPSPACSR